MEITIAEETDHEQWDAIVGSTQNGTLFHTWKWLKLLEKHSVLKTAGRISSPVFYPVFIKEKDKPVGIYPLFIFKTLIGSFCYSPPSNVDLLYLGPLFPELTNLKEEKRQIFLQEVQEVVDAFIRNEMKSSYVQINTPPGFDDCRLFKWGGYTAVPRYTYYLDLHGGVDLIWKSFNRSLRYYIEKARKEGITVVEGTKDDAFFIYDLLKERERIKSPKEYIGDVFDLFSPDHVKIFVAKAGDERLSGIITIIEKDKVSFWVGSPRCSYRGLSPNELILWESIRWAGDHGFGIYEIEGADDFSLFPFKRKFNGAVIPYYQMKWLSPGLNFLSSLVHAVKPNNKSLLES